jgi:O-antigen/teichoic acid export membrane protein
VNAIFSTALLVYLVFGAVIIAVAYPTLDAILNVLTIPEGMEKKARVVLELTIIALVWGNIIAVYQSLITGLQRLDVQSGIVVFISMCYAIGCVVVLELGFGIQGLAVNQLITQAITMAVVIYFAYRLYPGLRFELTRLKEHFITLLRYGVNLQVSTIAVLINFQLDKILVSRFIDASHVTFYDIGSRLPTVARSIPTMLLPALVPASSELEVREGRAGVYELFSRVSKYVAVVACPLFAGVLATGQSFIRGWVGHGYDVSVVVMRILCVGYLFNIMAGAASPLVAGIGRPEYLRNAEALSLFLNIVLSILLVKVYGFYGAPVGTSIAMSVAAIYYLWSFHRLMERPLFPLLKNAFLKPGLCSVASGSAALTVTATLTPYVSDGRLGALLIFIAAGSVFVVSYVLLILKCRHFDERDIALLREHLPFMSS